MHIHIFVDIVLWQVVNTVVKGDRSEGTGV